MTDNAHHKILVNGLCRAASAAARDHRPQCRGTVDAIVDAFIEREVGVGEALVVLVAIVRQLSRLARDGIARVAEEEGVTTIPECEPAHVLTALAQLTGYELSEYKAIAPANDDGRERAN